MNVESRDIKMLKLNKYAREYIENYENKVDYEKVTKQMKDFSGAEYVMFNIFDEKGKDFTLVGFEGNKKNIEKAMNIIGYNIIGKKFKYEEGRNEKFEKSIVTKVESLKALVGNALPKAAIPIIEKVFKIESILTVRITKDEKTIGNFTLLFSNHQNRNDNEMLKLFASQVGLYISKKINELKIEETKERLENIIKGTNVGTWEINLKTGESVINERWAEMIGYKLEEILPATKEKREKLIHPDDLKKLQRVYQKALNKEIEYYDIEFRKKHKNGKWIWVNARAKVTKWGEDGKAQFISGALIDITQKKQYEQKIINMKERLENIIEGTNVGTWERNLQTGEATIDERWAEILGYKLEELLPMNTKLWQSLINNDDLEKTKKEVRKLINKEIEYYDVEYRMKHKNGKWIWVNGRGKITKWSKDRKPISISGTTMNIAEKKEKQEKIEYLSFHDPLTGLYNRRYMQDSIKRLDTSRNIPFSIIVADINGLKLTNDAYGHEMGDKLLLSASEILKKSCRKEDIICRVGGDEFVILLPNTDEKSTEEIIERIKDESRSTKLESVIISLAIGASTKNKEDETILTIYKEADNNMYKDKIKHGRMMRSKTIETLLVNINNKYDNEQIHTERTSQYCESISKAMKLSEQEIQDAKIAGVLHDIGKIVVSPNILNKSEKLKDKEWGEIKRHPTISYQLLKNVDEYAHLAEAVLYHHEKLDGSGYPEGLIDEEIPLLSKIIAVADAYEAMTADRPYKDIKTKKEAIEELKKYSGSQFDKDIVDVFINDVL